MRLLIDAQDAFLTQTRDLLRAGHTGAVINEAALGHLRDHTLAGPLLQRLPTHEQRRFADAAAWMTHLGQLGMTGLRVTPDPVRVAAEAAFGVG